MGERGKKRMESFFDPGLTIIFWFKTGYDTGRDLSGFAAEENGEGFGLGHDI